MDQVDELSDAYLAFVGSYAAATVVIACHILFDWEDEPIPREPAMLRDLVRNHNLYRLFFGGRLTTYECLRMDRGPFFHLARMLRNGGNLRDTNQVSIEEQLAMFLNILGHNTKYRMVGHYFLRSKETISRHFNAVLRAILKLRPLLMRQPGNQTAKEIHSRTAWYPWFQDCIGMIDGTHIEASVPDNVVARFRGRKDVPTQNVLAAVTPNKQFCYVMAGWEGSAHDFAVLKDALSMPPPKGICILKDKYYLCDAGYTTMPGFIAPYRGVRYHLKEQVGKLPMNHHELFNLRHSSLRSKIESAFGILKKRFRILKCRPDFPFESQVKIVIACCILHNYIMQVDPVDRFVHEDVNFNEGPEDVFDERVVYNTRGLTLREQKKANQEWLQMRDALAKLMWVDYCAKERGGDETETGLDG